MWRRTSHRPVASGHRRRCLGPSEHAVMRGWTTSCIGWKLKYQYSKLQVPRMILYIPGSEKLLIPGLHLQSQGMYTTWNDPTTLCFTPDILLWCRDTENHSRNLDCNLIFLPTCSTTDTVQVLTRRQSTRWWRGRGTLASSSSVRLTRLFSPAGPDTCQPISCSS